MSKKLKSSLEELKTLSAEELIDKRNSLIIERSKIESKLNEADDSKIEGKEIDSTWYRRTEFAYKATGLLMSAIDSEMGIRRQNKAGSFHKTFFSYITENFPDIAAIAIKDIKNGAYE